MTVAAGSDDSNLTIGEVAEYIVRTGNSVNIGGMILSRPPVPIPCVFQIDTDMDTWEPGDPLKWHPVDGGK